MRMVVSRGGKIRVKKPEKQVPNKAVPGMMGVLNLHKASDLQPCNGQHIYIMRDITWYFN